MCAESTTRHCERTELLRFGYLSTVTPTFLLYAGAMLVLALVLVLRPLLRGAGPDRARQQKLDALDQALAAGVLDEAEFARKRKALLSEGAQPGPRAALWPAVAVALVLGLGTTLVYRTVGTPAALDPEAMKPTAAAAEGHGGSNAPDMEAAIQQLAQRMQQEPDDLQGWLLLGRAYRATNRFNEARDALARARTMAPDDVDTMVEYAEALALSSTEREISGEPLQLIETALTRDPNHQRALWLRGIAHAQVEQYREAVAVWEKLLGILPPDSEVIGDVRTQIAEARTRAGMPPPAPLAAAAASATTSATPPASDAGAAAGAALTVKIDISPELKARLAPSDVLYVFARPPEGPRMPLAMQRLPAASLPVTVTLDDSMGMMPTLKLSNAERVVVGARVSKSGVANAQAGDYEALSAPIVLAEQALPLELVIRDVIR